jgi:hypothetical protein
MDAAVSMASIWASVISSDGIRGMSSLWRGMGRAVFAGLLVLALCGATRVYQAPEAFIADSFGGNPPPAQTLCLTGPVREGAASILRRQPPPRLTYWRAGGQTVFVLEEIGKEQPITTGILIRDGRITRVSILVYRESRGDEVRYPAFTRQFEGAGLGENQRLDRTINGISGATLSVNALDRMTRLALFLDRHLSAGQGESSSSH